MNIDMLLKELLDSMREHSKRLQENAINDKEREVEIKNLKEQVTTLKEALNDLKERVEAIELARTEINGFTKYAKLIWLAIAAVAGYLLK